MIGSLIGGFVAFFILWLISYPNPSMDFGSFLKNDVVVFLGTLGAAFGAVVGLIIGVVQVIWDGLHRTEASALEKSGH